MARSLRKILTDPFNPEDEETQALLRRAAMRVLPQQNDPPVIPARQPVLIDPTLAGGTPLYVQPVDAQNAQMNVEPPLLTRPRTVAIPPAETAVDASIPSRVVAPSDNYIADRSITDRPSNVVTPDIVPSRRIVDPTDLGGGSTFSGASAEGDALDSSSRSRWSDRMNKYLSRREYDEENPPKISKKGAFAVSGLNWLSTVLGKPPEDPSLLTFSPKRISESINKRRLAEDDQQIDQSYKRQTQQANIDWMKRKPEIQDQRVMSQRQAALMRQLSMQGKYKRGENPRLDAQIDQAGLSVSDFDKSRGQNPIFRSSNGTQYQYNRQTGQFEEAQGIPQDQGGIRVPYRLSDGSIVNVRQDTAATADAAKQARDLARQDRMEQQTYQRGRDAQSDQRYDTQRRQSVTSHLRTLYDLYRRAEQADAYGDSRGVEDATALRREADSLADEVEATYGDIEGVKGAIRKAKGETTLNFPSVKPPPSDIGRGSKK